MKKTNIFLISIFATGIAGCGGGGANDTTSGTTNVSPTGSTASDVAPADTTANDAAPVDSTNVVSIGANPGALPDPVLAEVLSIPMADVGGHKLFGGPNAVYNLGTLYANYQFECDGTGTFETWPTPTFAFLFAPVTGTITWSVDELRGRLAVDIVSSSDGEDGLSEDVFIGERLNDGVYVVGDSSLDGRIVTHILQFEECNR